MCSCHFRDGKNSNGPEIFERNKDKLFPTDGRKVREPPKKKQKCRNSTTVVVQDVVDSYRKQQEGQSQNVSTIEQAVLQVPTAQMILEVELDQHKRELAKHNETMQYQRSHYTVKSLSTEVLRMETGLPTKEVFDIVVRHALRFKDSIIYFSGWKVTSISFENQILITLMKVR